MTATVSVVCPTYNRSADIEPTLTSVLAQSFVDLELIVVSDGSTDDTDEVVREIARQDTRVRLVRIPRSGHPSTARNAGLAVASGSIVSYIDHDDRWRNDHLTVSVDLLLRSSAALVATGFEAVGPDGARTRSSTTAGLCWHPELQILDPLFEPSRVSHRRGVVEALGGWRVTSGLEDWDLWFRAAGRCESFATTAAQTVTLFESDTTRRHGIRPAHVLELCAYDDPMRGRAVIETAGTCDGAAELAAAAAEDAADLIDGLSRDARFVLPEVSVACGDSDDEGTAAGSSGPRLLLVPKRRRFVVCLPLWCSSPRHAKAIATLAPTAYRRQLEVFDRWSGSSVSSAT